jgi:hypothetical protein
MSVLKLLQMTYKASLKVQFDTEWTSTHYGSGYDDSMLPEEHYTFQIPAEDLNIHQLFHFFATVARAMGHDEINIMKGGCGLAFGEGKSEKNMRKVADEFDLTLGEDLKGKFDDMREAEAEWARLKKGPMGTVLSDDNEEQLKLEILDLKAKLSRYENPDNPNYTEEEMDAMTAENEE